jgi:nucleotide-binding universal stress UspA family protein
MFKRILVPLDGSILAESALPTAATVAQKLGATITLLHLLEKAPPASIHGERHLREAAEADHYLADVAKRFFAETIGVSYHVHDEKTSNVAAGIAEHQKELSPDLIIMCSHGEGGLRRWISGTLAQKTAGYVDIPVLLVRPAESTCQPSFERILLPLDGTSAHEAAIPMALQLARIFAAKVHLLRVVQTPEALSGPGATVSRMLPGASRVMLDLTAEDAKHYLESVAEKFRQANISVHPEVLRGKTVETIIAEAKTHQTGLIILATHGKAGTTAFWAGSIAPQVADNTCSNVLLIPAN